jgi:segregation and condensation protein B
VIDRFQQLRILEAMLFSASGPLAERVIEARMPDGVDVQALLAELQAHYANRGVHLRRIGKGWAFRTAPDLATYLRVETEVQRRLSRAAIETLAIIAYHQPITRAEIEEMRGVSLSRGTLDTLLEASWIRPRGRRRTAGRPTTWGTTEMFLDQFGIESMEDLPGVEELKAAGLLDRRPGFGPLSEIREQATTEEDTEEAQRADNDSSPEDDEEVDAAADLSETEAEAAPEEGESALALGVGERAASAE